MCLGLSKRETQTNPGIYRMRGCMCVLVWGWFISTSSHAHLQDANNLRCHSLHLVYLFRLRKAGATHKHGAVIPTPCLPSILQFPQPPMRAAAWCHLLAGSTKTRPSHSPEQKHPREISVSDGACLADGRLAAWL